jgi:hypothetical protein
MLQSFISCCVIGFSRAQWGYKLYMKRRAYGYKPRVLYINWVTLFHKRHLLTARISTGAHAQRWMTAESASETFTAETAAVTAGVNSIGTWCSLSVPVVLSRYDKDLGNLFFSFYYNSQGVWLKFWKRHFAAPEFLSIVFHRRLHYKISCHEIRYVAKSGKFNLHSVF